VVVRTLVGLDELAEEVTVVFDVLVVVTTGGRLMVVFKVVVLLNASVLEGTPMQPLVPHVLPDGQTLHAAPRMHLLAVLVQQTAPLA
jgi:hypothetical protein